MVNFPVEFSNRAGKYIKKYGSERLKEKIEKLEENPFPQDIERVEGFKGEKVFRVRVGDERILYIVRYNPNRLIVVKIDKRSRVYD